MKKVRPRSRPPPPRLEWPSLPTAAAAAAAAAAAGVVAIAARTTAPDDSAPASASVARPTTTSRPISSYFGKSPGGEGGKKRTRVTFEGGGGTATSSSQLSDNKKEAALRGHVPPTGRRGGTPAANKNHGDNDFSALWTESHAPTTVESVCVAPKKVKEISQWLGEGASSASESVGRSTSGSGSGSGSGLLIVVGSPGIGKSTLVRLLARQNGFDVHEWSESVSSSGAYYHPDILSQPTPLDSFEAFLRQSRAGYASLVSVVEPRPRATPSSKPGASRTTARQKEKRNQRSVILLEEIPNLHGADMEERFRSLFEAHVQESTGRPTRTILIWSHVTEGKHHRDDLERLLPPRTLYDPRHVHVVQVHPPTKARFGKIVDAVARRRGVRPVDAASLYETSGGDVRFAITALQFEGDGARAGVARKGDATRDRHDRQRRDERLNPMHALGKLLYAKRSESSNAPTTPTLASPSQGAAIHSRWHDARSKLAYDPDDVLDRCEMELPGALQFLAYHAADFMMDVEELSCALERYSDAAWLMEARGSRPHSSSAAAPHALVTSMAGSVACRAVSTFNLHPAPSKFRQLSKPRSFDAVRKRTENQSALRSFLSGAAAVTLESVDKYATDSLAFVRRIQPDAAPPMESFVASSSDRAGRFGGRIHESEEQMALTTVPSVLEGDDIGDYSDSDDALNWTRVAREVKESRLSLQLAAPSCHAIPTPTTVATSPASSSGTGNATD